MPYEQFMMNSSLYTLHSLTKHEVSAEVKKNP